MSSRWGNAQPIETVYQGYRFRSRLEARWAVFFDSLRVKWEYEPEGFNLEGIWYLPDFWLTDLKCWVEIKPEEPNEDEKQKAWLLAVATKTPCFIFYHIAGSNLDQLGIFGQGMSFDSNGATPKKGVPYHWWCICPKCNQAGIELIGWSGYVCGCRHFQLISDETSDSENGFLDERFLTLNHPRILQASLAARQARFEDK